jgi:flagellar protein FliL
MAAAAEEKSEQVSSAPASGGAGGGTSNVVLILTAVNTIAMLGMAGLLFVSFQKEKSKSTVDDIAAHGDASHGAPAAGHGEAAKGGADAHGKPGDKKPLDYGRMITLDQFTVNLSTPGSATPKYVRVNISLEVPTDDAEGEVTSKMPQVRNVIIDLFNSKRPSDLASAEGRDYLKEEIRNALNGFLVNGKVKGVFFTNFALTS